MQSQWVRCQGTQFVMKLPTICLTDDRCCCPAANAKQQGGHKLDIPLVSYYVSTLDERLRGGLQECFTGAVVGRFFREKSRSQDRGRVHLKFFETSEEYYVGTSKSVTVGVGIGMGFGPRTLELFRKIWTLPRSSLRLFSKKSSNYCTIETVL